MVRKVCMGNEAIALGALAAGLKLAAGYPGTPSTEIIETLVRERRAGVGVQWSVNEKAALEVAAGGAYAGARTLCTMKQVGLNVASDPLMSLAYIGVKGGMVVAVADDPGPWSSQTEQDTRGFAKHANLPVFDPSSPEEAYEMIQTAFDFSEKYALPVFLRPTTRVCHASAEVELREPSPIKEADGFERRPEWCIFPALSYRKHGELEVKQREMARDFDAMTYNRIENYGVGGRRAIAASGISYLYAKEALNELGADATLYKVGTPYPMPEKLTKDFLAGADSVLVLEELDPVVEEQLLIEAAGRVPVLGKRSGDMPWNGEYSFELIKAALAKYLGLSAEAEAAPELPQLPVRPPVLCAGCPHRASFYEAKVATKDCKKSDLLRRHRLLHARQRRAAQHGGHLPLHGRGHNARPGARADRAGREVPRLHRRLDLLPHGNPRRNQRRLPGDGHHDNSPRQPHDRDDRPPAAPGHGKARARRRQHSARHRDAAARLRRGARRARQPLRF